MSETTTVTPQENAATTQNTTTLTGMERLSQDDLFKDTPAKTETPTTTTTPANTEKPTETTQAPELSLTEQEALKTEAKALGLAETATKEEIEVAKLTKPADALIDEGFKEETDTKLVAEEGTWKSYFEQNNIPIPEDFSEDNAIDLVRQHDREAIKAEYEEKLTITAEEILSPYPPEARLILDLMAAGQTMEEINAPINKINAYKAMSKEELVRENLKGLGFEADEIDHKMETLLAGDKLDIEYKILMKEVAQLEKRVNAQRQQYLNDYKANQETLKAQKRTQDLNLIKNTMDRMPTFMDRKLSAENKASVINDYNNGAFDRLMQDPKEKIEFMLYKKYGKQVLQSAKGRAIEQATLEKAKNQHNVPLVQNGNANVTDTTNKTGMTGMDRLKEDFG